MCGPWGVEAAEDIPKRGFVCTVAGQVRIFRSLNVVAIGQGCESGAGLLVRRLPHGLSRETEPRRRISTYRSIYERNKMKKRDENEKENAKGEERNGDNEQSPRPSHLPPLGDVDRELVVDQRRYANISRYLRRARTEAGSNLLRVAVHTANQDPSAPVLALFAADVIPKGTELLLGP
ncbi:unnamed protein product [Sphacelaria rigidula]